MDSFILNVNTEALNLIITSLATHPYNEVAGLIDGLKSQAITQIELYNAKVAQQQAEDEMRIAQQQPSEGVPA